MSSTTGPSGSRSSGRTAAAAILGLIAVLSLVAAIVYIAEPAGSLPGFMGHVAGSTGHHPLRLVGSLVVAVVFAIGAWFALVYKPKPQSSETSSRESSPAGRG